MTAQQSRRIRLSLARLSLSSQTSQGSSVTRSLEAAAAAAARFCCSDVSRLALSPGFRSRVGYLKGHSHGPVGDGENIRPLLRLLLSSLICPPRAEQEALRT